MVGSQSHLGDGKVGDDLPPLDGCKLQRISTSSRHDGTQVIPTDKPTLALLHPTAAKVHYQSTGAH
jgi:hypothetical protein